MSMNLRILIFLVSIILAIVILIILKKGRMPLKYSLVWFIPIILMLFISLLPDAMWRFTKIIGFQTVSNLVIGIMFVMLFFVCISLTIIISGQKTKITLLIQEISMLKEQYNHTDLKK